VYLVENGAVAPDGLVKDGLYDILWRQQKRHRATVTNLCCGAVICFCSVGRQAALLPFRADTAADTAATAYFAAKPWIFYPS
jgi:hypothetical protein